MTMLTDPATPAAAPAAAPASPASPAAPAAPAGFSFPDNWKESLPEDLRSDPSMGVVTDINSLAKSYINAQKMIGADKIVVPSKHATDEDWSGVFQKLGLPKELKDYSLEMPKDVPLDAKFIEDFKANAHANGLLPRHAQKVLDWYSQSVSKLRQENESAVAAQIAQGTDALKKEWGQAYDTHITAAKLAIKDFGDENFSKFLAESGMGNNPEVIKVFAKIGMALREDAVKGAVSRGGEGALTPDEAIKKYNSIISDQAHPYNKGDHPNHQAAVQEVSKLFGMAFSTST